MRWWPAGAARPCQVLALFELLRFDVDEKIKSEKISVSSCKDDTHNLHKKNDTEKMNTSTCCTSPVLPAMGAGGDEGTTTDLLPEKTCMTPNKDDVDEKINSEKISISSCKEDTHNLHNKNDTEKMNPSSCCTSPVLPAMGAGGDEGAAADHLPEKTCMTPNKDDTHIDIFGNEQLVASIRQCLVENAKKCTLNACACITDTISLATRRSVAHKASSQFLPVIERAAIAMIDRHIADCKPDINDNNDKHGNDNNDKHDDDNNDKLNMLDSEDNDITSDPDDWLNTAQDDDDDDEVDAEAGDNFGVGDNVLVHGLLRAPHLNNLIGAIGGYDALADRYIVSFAPKVTPTKIKACNLMFPARCPFCSSEVTGSHCHACPSGELLLHESIRMCNSSSMIQTEASLLSSRPLPGPGTRRGTPSTLQSCDADDNGSSWHLNSSLHEQKT
jgi:hypothetical protein